MFLFPDQAQFWAVIICLILVIVIYRIIMFFIRLFFYRRLGQKLIIFFRKTERRE